MSSKTRKFLLLFIVVILSTTAISACSTQNQSAGLSMMPMDKMPAEVQSAPVAVSPCDAAILAPSLPASEQQAPIPTPHAQ